MLLLIYVGYDAVEYCAIDSWIYYSLNFIIFIFSAAARCVIDQQHSMRRKVGEETLLLFHNSQVFFYFLNSSWEVSNLTNIFFYSAERREKSFLYRWGDNLSNQSVSWVADASDSDGEALKWHFSDEVKNVEKIVGFIRGKIDVKIFLLKKWLG